LFLVPSVPVPSRLVIGFPRARRYFELLPFLYVWEPLTPSYSDASFLSEMRGDRVHLNWTFTSRSLNMCLGLPLSLSQYEGSSRFAPLAVADLLERSVSIVLGVRLFLGSFRTTQIFPLPPLRAVPVSTAASKMDPLFGLFRASDLEPTHLLGPLTSSDIPATTL